MDITNGIDLKNEIAERISFGDFDSKEMNMWLISRSAPTPAKNEIVESVAFMNGLHDFSRILGEDTYQNRPLTYTFHIYQRDREYRKHNQTVLENKLMKHGVVKLEDTYDKNYHYLGKCTGVSVEDDHVYGRLIVTINFDCYPFKIANEHEGADIWDTFNFDLDAMQPVAFEVDGQKEITLYNLGLPSVVPEITVNGDITVSNGQRQTTITNGTFKNESFRLMPGENTLTLSGQGTIDFYFYKELI